jgi:predicted glutamine amidotransferase
VDDWRKIAMDFSRQAETGNLPPERQADPGHKDGWGMTISNSGQTAMVPLARQLGSAHESTGYREALDSLPDQPDIFLCHLRKASDNIAITLSNTHPFVHNGWAFIHNGTVFEAESLPRHSGLVLTSDDSDTEHLFQYLLTKIIDKPRDKSIAGAIVEAVSSVTLEYTSLNFMLSNGRHLYVLRNFRKNDTYYTLYYYQLAAGIIICSQPVDFKGLNQSSWKLIDNKSLLRFHSDRPRLERFNI